MRTLNYVLAGILASSVAFNIFSIIFMTKISGTLLIDTSDSEKDLYKFCIDDLDSLSKKKKIVIKVDSKAVLSHQ